MHPADIAALARALAGELRSGRSSAPGVGAPGRIRSPFADNHPEPSTGGGFVYFARCDDDLGLIKIGIAIDVKRRLDMLRVGCPHELFYEAYEWREDYKRREQDLHERFSHARFRGEWFHPADEVIAEIKRIRIERRGRFAKALKL